MSGNPRRVAFVLTQDRGGPVDVCRALADRLRHTGAADVHVFGPAPAGGPAGLRDRWTEIDVGAKSDVGGARELHARLRAFAPDVVHAHDRRAGLVLTAAAWRRRRPVLVATYHGVPEDVTEPWLRGRPGAPPPSRYTRATLAADAVVARLLDRTVVPSGSMLRFLRDRLRVPSSRLAHVDNGLPLDPPAPASSGPVRRLLVVGILLERKGITDLLEALARPGVFPPDARLTIAGDGPQRTDIERSAARPELAGRVALLGFRRDVGALMRDCDAVVVPSRMEQQPLVVIEAMAAGRPVLGTDTGDVATMLDAPGAARHLAVPGDVDALVAALRGLFADPDPGRTGRLLAERAVARYSDVACADAHVALYARLTGVPDPVPEGSR